MKNKKLITAIILTIIALSATCYNLQKYNDENDFIVTVHDKTVEITGYKGTKTDVNIPPRIGKLPVTAIGNNAFYVSSQENKEKLTSVKIPNGVTVIGDYAFYNNNLSKIIIPDTVVSIGREAFACNKLVSVKIPNTVTKIGSSAFAHNDITEIVLPDHITEIGYWVFQDNKLTSITIPESVVTIGISAFESNELTELTIPRNVISIRGDAFNDLWGKNRNNITKVTIGDNVKLGRGAINRFNYYYDSAVMKRGGTYILSDHYWKPEDKSIPVYGFYPVNGWESPDIQFLPDMPDLKEVTLRNNDFLTDITPLSELTKIEILSIIKCPNIKSIKPLASLVNLESLSLTHNNNYDYRDIASLQKLEILSISGDHLGEIDLSSIGQLHYVKRLYLSDWLEATTIKNINELKNLTNLEELDIRNVDNLDLSWASNLRNLTELSMIGCTVKDISPLANLPNLVKIHLHSHIKDITPLLRSNSIKYVSIFEYNVEGGISDNIRSRFQQKGIELDVFSDDH